MPKCKIKNELVAETESKLVNRLRIRGGVSRVALARELKLAPSTVGIYADRLIEEGFLLEGRKERARFGRPPTLLELNPKGGLFVGVDFEARTILARAVDFSQQPLKQSRQTLRPNETAAGVLKRIEQAIVTVTKGHKRALLGIGVGVPGAIDPERGLAIHYEYIKGWKDVPLVDRLSAKFGAPVYLENNIRSMALAELWFGKGRGVNNFVCLGIRSGVGAGIVVDGKLCRGHANLAGEIGGWPCPRIPLLDAPGAGPSGAANGRIEKLEEVGSVRAILNALDMKGGRVDWQGVLRRARDGNPLVCRTLERVARTHGWVVSQLNLMFNPEKVILAGPLTALGDSFLGPIRDVVRELAPPLHSEVPEIVCSELGEFGGALGAAALAVHQWKPVR